MKCQYCERELMPCEEEHYSVICDYCWKRIMELEEKFGEREREEEE